ARDLREERPRADLAVDLGLPLLPAGLREPEEVRHPEVPRRLRRARGDDDHRVGLLGLLARGREHGAASRAVLHAGPALRRGDDVALRVRDLDLVGAGARRGAGEEVGERAALTLAALALAALALAAAALRAAAALAAALVLGVLVAATSVLAVPAR